MAEFEVHYDDGTRIIINATKYEYDANRFSYVFTEEINEVASIPRTRTTFVGKRDAIKREL